MRGRRGGEGVGGGEGGLGGRMARALLLPVELAKFGPTVGAAHAQVRTALILYSDRTAAAVRAEQSTRAILGTRSPAGHDRPM